MDINDKSYEQTLNNGHDYSNGLHGDSHADGTAKYIPSLDSSWSTVVHKDIVNDLQDGALPDLMVKQLLKMESGQTYYFFN